MAISLKTAGTWARVVTDPSSVTIPGTPAAGDRMFLFASWKTFDVTVADPSNWTPIVNSFADGTTAAGNGTGSVSVAAWYRDWVTGDANPSLNWSASPTEAHAVVMLWTKAGGDTWATPQFATAAIAAADPFSATATSTLTIADASVVMCMVALRDDSTTLARSATTAIGNGSVTWNGNYVESPATHFNSTTGLDMSGDLGHRFVTTGGAGVSLTTTGDPAAAESGTALWVAQALFVSDPKTAAPTAASLTATGATPTVTASDHKSAAPTAAAATLTGEIPTVAVTANQLAVPDAVALVASGDTPAVSLPVATAPSAGSMTTTGSTPTVALAIIAAPSAGSLTATGATPAIALPITAEPDELALILTPDTPAIALPVASQPSSGALVTTGAVPVVDTGEDEDVEVAPASVELTVTLATPTVSVTANVRVSPSAAAVLLAFDAPLVAVTQNRLALPPAASLLWRGVAPLVTGPPQSITAGGAWEPPNERLPHPQYAAPRAARLGLTPSIPDVRVGDDADVFALFTGVA